MMEPEKQSVYGPVRSRRFGWDVGINLLPTDRKLCTFDCVYCQYGFNGHEPAQPVQFADINETLQAWEQRVHESLEKGIRVRHTTIAGNGEPTMHPQFIWFAEEFVRLRNEAAPYVRLAVLSNGYRLHDPEIRRALCLFDEPVLKLDAGSQKSIQGINHPRVRFDLPRYLGDLRKCNRLILQTMFARGWNDSPQDVNEWIEAVRQANPVSVQIYTLDRAPALEDMQPLHSEELLRIAREASALTGIPVHAYL